MGESTTATEPFIEIRLAYDTFKGDYLEVDTSYYEYSEITKMEYEVSLSPIGKDLQSPLETPSENDDRPDVGEYRRTVTQQDSNHCDQLGADDGSNEVTGTITLITRKKRHAQTCLVEAYFNGNRSAVTLDTGSSVSIIHLINNPAQDRVFKIREERTYYLPCQGDVNWRESSNDTELTVAKSNVTQETNDDELRKGTSDDDELYTSDDDELYTSDDEELYKSDDDELYTSDDNDIVNYVANGSTPAEIIEFITSERVRVHRYLDDVNFYEDVSEEGETTQRFAGFIDTDGILNDLMPGDTIPEATEISMTEDYSKAKGKDEASESYECQEADDPRRGGKTNNKAIRNLDTKSVDSANKDESDEACEMHQTYRESLDDASGDRPDKPYGKCETPNAKEMGCNSNQIKNDNNHTVNCRKNMSEDMVAPVDTSSKNKEGIEAHNIRRLDSEEMPDIDIIWNAEGYTVHTEDESESREESYWDDSSHIKEENIINIGLDLDPKKKVCWATSETVTNYE